MSQYRIVVEKEASGRDWYYTQYKFCRFFWRYHRTAFLHRNRWPTLGAAVHDIEMRIAAQNNEKQKAIVKREIINYPPKKMTEKNPEDKIQCQCFTAVQIGTCNENCDRPPAEPTIVRQNLMTRPGYTPYRGNNISRDSPGGCDNPRTYFTSNQFRCHKCGFETQFEEEFITRYKEKWKL